MEKDRLNAFSDGVLAIIITIMVLELKVPKDASVAALLEFAPLLGGYAISFVYIAIYWNNHHHMMHVVARVNGRVLWANNNLLFWLSLVPFATEWIGATGYASFPTMVYGVSLLMAAIAYAILEKAIIGTRADDGLLERAIGRPTKERVSLALYIAGIGGSLFHPLMGVFCYMAVAAIWVQPDQRIEKLATADE